MPGRENVPGLIRELGDDNPDVAHKARGLLMPIVTEEDLPVLTKIAIGSSKWGGAAATHLLAKLQAKDALFMILERAESRMARGVALRNLAETYPSEATPALLKALKVADENLARDIVTALGKVWAVPREPRNRRHPLPTDRVVPDEVKEVIRRSLGSNNFLMMHSAVDAAADIKFDEVLPILEHLGKTGHASFVANALMRFDSPEAGKILVNLLSRQYDDPLEYGNIIAAFPLAPFDGAVAALAAVLDDKRETRFNGNRVCDWAIERLASYLPDGPGFSKPQLHYRTPESDQYPYRDHIVEAWKAFIAFQADSTLKNRLALVQALYRLADAWKDAPTSIYPPPALRWFRQMEKFGKIDGLLDQVATPAQISSLQRALTTTEIALYTRLIGYEIKRTGKAPEFPWRSHRYPPSERDRFDSSGHLLDLWGHAYVYSSEPRHGQQFSIHSIGPNGRDEDGEGDDIKSW